MGYKQNFTGFVVCMTVNQYFNYFKWSIELVHKTYHQIIVCNHILTCFLSKLQFEEKKWKNQNVLKLPLKNFPFWFFQAVLKLKILKILKTGTKFIIWQTFTYFHTVHCAGQCSSERSYAEWYCALIEPIKSFLASHYSQCDSETWRLLDVRDFTNPMDTFILSQKTKSSMLPKLWDRRRRDGCLTVGRMFDRTEQDRDRARHARTWQDEDRKDCFSWI